MLHPHFLPACQPIWHSQDWATSSCTSSSAWRQLSILYIEIICAAQPCTGICHMYARLPQSGQLHRPTRKAQHTCSIARGGSPGHVAACCDKQTGISLEEDHGYLRLCRGRAMYMLLAIAATTTNPTKITSLQCECLSASVTSNSVHTCCWTFMGCQ